jgi:predicted RNA binding protein YcfA (HicA-like mRNA interferase family)
MSKLPRVTVRQMAEVLERLGFTLTRQSGSHQIYRNAASSKPTIPYHAAKILRPNVLKSI